MYRIPLFAAIVISVCVLIPVAMRGNQSSPLPTPPELRAHNHALSLTLHAVADSNGRDVFAFTCRSRHLDIVIHNAGHRSLDLLKHSLRSSSLSCTT